MESKTFKHSVEEATDEGIVTIAISRFNVKDSDKDIVRKGSFKKTFKEDNGRIKHIIDHYVSTQTVVGLPMKMYETETHAVVESALNLEKQTARDLLSDYKFFRDHGKSLEHSYGFQITRKQENDDIEGIDITEVKMFEYSTVLFGANENTPLLGLKSLKSHELETYLRKYDVSEEKGQFVELIIKAIKALDEPDNATLESLFRSPSLTLLDALKNYRKQS